MNKKILYTIGVVTSPDAFKHAKLKLNHGDLFEVIDKKSNNLLAGADEFYPVLNFYQGELTEQLLQHVISLAYVVAASNNEDPKNIIKKLLEDLKKVTELAQET